MSEEKKTSKVATEKKEKKMTASKEEKEKNAKDSKSKKEEKKKTKKDETLSKKETTAEDGKKKKEKRKRRKDMTPEEKKRQLKIDLTITFSVFGAFALFFIICAIISAVGTKANFAKAKSLDPVGTQYVEVTEETYNGYTEAEREKKLYYDSDLHCYTFVTNGDFKILQLTDIHIGAGSFSTKKDSLAIKAVSDVVRKVKPDLVIITGDMAFPVAFEAGTFNNLREAEMFATIMDTLDVYWTITFGNHDTEAYSIKNRDEIASQVYSDPKWKKCLFESNPTMFNNEGKKYSIDGAGNQLINVQKTNGDITQSLYMIDSHSYTDGDILGLAWKYDKIHDNQVAWYGDMVNRINEVNHNRGEDFGDVKSLMFFHIPLIEYGDAWELFKNNGHKNYNNNGTKVTYLYGVAGEKGEKSYPSTKSDGKMFDKIVELGSTQGIFCGHDHYNNYSLQYEGTKNDKNFSIRLTYGMSIDHLAYPGIWKKTAQRGGTEIIIKNDGKFTVTPRPHTTDDNSYMYDYWKQE